MARLKSASSVHIRRHYDVLCEQIGNRYSGSKSEQAAADYIESQLKRFGLTNIHQHPFEFPNWRASKGTLRVSRAGRMKRIGAA